jgi:hypothetical protein
MKMLHHHQLNWGKWHDTHGKKSNMNVWLTCQNIMEKHNMDVAEDKSVQEDHIFCVITVKSFYVSLSTEIVL